MDKNIREVLNSSQTTEERVERINRNDTIDRNEEKEVKDCICSIIWEKLIHFHLLDKYIDRISYFLLDFNKCWFYLFWVN